MAITGGELRRRRKACGLSLERLATAARVGWATLQRYETDRPRTDLSRGRYDPDKVGRVVAALEAAERNGG